MRAAGSDWYQGDWHVHTPFSRCFEEWNVTPADIWQRLTMLDYAIVTDHNTFDGYLNLLQHKPATTTVLFPGVELRVAAGYRGLSLLVVLNPELGPEDLTLFLRELGLCGADGGDRAIVVPRSLGEVAQVIRKYEGLALWSGLDTDQGILRGVDQVQRDYILQLGWPHNLMDWGLGQAEGPFAGVWSSNAHRLADIGRGTTLLKAEQLNFAGLRFALQDPDSRLKQGGLAVAESYPVLINLSVKGGFLAGQDFAFNSGLNCLIGARGAGKTTVLRLLGFALGQNMQGIDALIGAGEVQLNLIHPQAGRLTVVRRCGTEPKVLDRRGQPASVDLGEFALFFPQGEIERVMLQPETQLRLLDSTGDWDQLSQAKERIALALEANGSQLQGLVQDLDDLEEQLTGQTGLEIRLRELQTYPLAEIQARLTERARQIQHYAGVKDLIKHNLLTLAKLNCLGEQGCGGEALDYARQETQVQIERLSALWQQAHEELDYLVAESERRHHQLEEEYHALLGGCADRRLKELVMERKSIQAELLKLEPVAREAAQVRTKIDELRQQRTVLLQDWTSLGQDIYQRRSLQAAKLNALLGNTVRLEVKRCGQIAPYRALLQQYLPGAGSQIIKNLVNYPPAELKKTLELGDAAALAARTGLTLARSRQVYNLLSSSKVLLKLETLDLPDLVQIYLKDGQEEKAGAQLSTGQRCTAVIPLLFLAGRGPLLIDQPEDQLDNAYVYSLLVAKLRQFKGQRQFIIATHNPNIPVLADAEQNFILHSNGRQGQVQAQGYIENIQVKELIQAIMEGGKDAFRRRAECYGQLAL